LGKKRDILFMPRHLVTLRFIELPSTDEAEIKDMVEFQALKEVPYSREELVISYRNIGSYRKGFSYIMLVIVKKQLIEEMMAKGENRPEDIRLETELFYLSLLKKGIVKHERASLAINIKKEYSELIVIDRARPVFSRGFRNAGDFLNEIDRSILAYKRDKNNREIDDITIIYASDVDIKDIKLHIKEYFNIPVNFYEDKEDLTNLDFPLEIGLLPKEYIDKKMYKENKKEILSMYFLIGLVILSLSSIFIFKLYEKNKIINILSNGISRVQPRIDMIDSLLKKTEILKSRRENGELILNILKESYGLIPADIVLSGMDYDGKVFISYKGTTRDTANVFNFIKALERIKYFKKVEVKYATKKEIKGQTITDFSIACQIGAGR